MTTTVDTHIMLIDRIIKLAYDNMKLASWLYKQEWLDEIDKALDERLKLMKLRDLQLVRNK